MASDSDSDSSDTPVFASDDVAKLARDAGIKLFNEDRLEEALQLQYGLLKHFTGKYGEASAECGEYYLDYGTTLLRIIQSTDTEAAILAGNTGEENPDIEVCMQNLGLALICLDKAEAALQGDELHRIYLRQAEAHEAQSEVYHECGEENDALKELECSLALRMAVLPKTDRTVVSNMLQIGLVYLRNEEFAKAEAQLEEVLAAAKESSISQEALDDIQAYLDEAREMREQGGLDNVKREIRELFPDEAPVEEAPGLVSSIPRGLAGGFAPSAFMSTAVPMREASSSLSFFPRQALSGESSMRVAVEMQPVNTSVQVKRKDRTRATPTDDAAKRNRAEPSDL